MYTWEFIPIAKMQNSSGIWNKKYLRIHIFIHTHTKSCKTNLVTLGIFLRLFDSTKVIFTVLILRLNTSTAVVLGHNSFKDISLNRSKLPYKVSNSKHKNKTEKVTDNATDWKLTVAANSLFYKIRNSTFGWAVDLPVFCWAQTLGYKAAGYWFYLFLLPKQKWTDIRLSVLGVLHICAWFKSFKNLLEENAQIQNIMIILNLCSRST